MTWRAGAAAPLQRCRRSRHFYSLGNLDTTREAQFERGDDAIATRTARHDQANAAVRRPRFVRTRCANELATAHRRIPLLRAGLHLQVLPGIYT